MKYRIAIQKVENNKYKHVYNIVIETKNIKKIIEKIRILLNNEIELRQELFNEWFYGRKKNYYSKLVKEIDNDLIDWASKGKDISKEDFLENEIFFEIRE